MRQGPIQLILIIWPSVISLFIEISGSTAIPKPAITHFFMASTSASSSLLLGFAPACVKECSKA